MTLQFCCHHNGDSRADASVREIQIEIHRNTNTKKYKYTYTHKKLFFLFYKLMIAGLMQMMWIPQFHACRSVTHFLQLSTFPNRGTFDLLCFLCTPFSHPQRGSIDFNTVNPSLPRGMDFLMDGLMMRRMSVLHQNSGGIGKSIPDAQEISRDPIDSVKINASR